MAVQSISPIYESDGMDQLCLLLGTRNGDVIMMRQVDYCVRKDKRMGGKKVEKRMSM